MKNIFKQTVGLILATTVISTSCSKLDEKVYDKAPVSAIGGGGGDIFSSAISGAYGGLRNFVGNDQWWGVEEACTDECIVPTRGNDWGDGNKWKDLWFHTFAPGNGAFFESIWTNSYAIVANANTIISDIDNHVYDGVTNPVVAKSEARALRAFAYYILMNDFGNVPLFTESTTNPLTSNATDASDPLNANNGQRKIIFNFIESELNAVIPNLSTAKDNSTYGRMNKWAALALQAKLYMNAEVYTGTPRWADAANACTQIINSGKYSLSTSFTSIFNKTNESNNEIIFQVPFDKVWGKGMKMQMMTLHYNSQATYKLAGSPWNGFCTTSDFLTTYDTANDHRARQTFLWGPAYNPDGSPVKDRGAAFVYKTGVTTFADPNGNNRDQGARGVKYFPEEGTTDNMSNDFVFFRLSDVMLMLTEAKFRQGTTDVSFVNQLRERAYGNTANGVSTLSLPFLLAERGRELAWEGWRRTDLIRFGKFQDQRPFMTAADGSTKTNVFPIGTQTLNKNSALKQNPGY